MPCRPISRFWMRPSAMTPMRSPLTLQRNDISFAEIGKTRNQIATARGLESLAFGMPVYDAVVQLDEDMAAFASTGFPGNSVDQLKPRSSRIAALFAKPQRQRVRAAFETRCFLHGAGRGLSRRRTGARRGRVQSFAGWGHAFDAWADMDSDRNAAALDRTEGGFFMGVDGAVRRLAHRLARRLQPFDPFDAGRARVLRGRAAIIIWASMAAPGRGLSVSSLEPNLSILSLRSEN